jgi:hypothetical protein
MSTEERVRLLRGSLERQTSQLQPITGTPTEVPVPRKRREDSAADIFLPMDFPYGNGKANRIRRHRN